MKWKKYYRDEFKLPVAENVVSELFAASSQNHHLDGLIHSGAILSFPHTSLFYAGGAQAQVVSSLYRTGIKHVIALGVFHVWGQEPTKPLYQQAMDDDEDPECREQAFSGLKGAFFPCETCYASPYGTIPFALFPPEEYVALHRDANGLLAQEYSLDTFFTLIKAYSLAHAIPPLQITPLYVGMTRDPVQGTFAVASEIGDGLKRMHSQNTAIVATGDVVHYGTGYSREELMRRMPSTADKLQPLLRKELQEILDLVLKRKEYAQAFPKLDSFLNNDQRYLLPVLSELLGKNADYDILSFRLSDYASINAVRQPCFVASSLIAYRPG